MSNQSMRLYHKQIKNKKVSFLQSINKEIKTLLDANWTSFLGLIKALDYTINRSRTRACVLFVQNAAFIYEQNAAFI